MSGDQFITTQTESRDKLRTCCYSYRDSQHTKHSLTVSLTLLFPLSSRPGLGRGPGKSCTRPHCVCLFMVVLAILNVGAGPFYRRNYDGEQTKTITSNLKLKTGDRAEGWRTAGGGCSVLSSAVFLTYLKIISKVISNISSRSYLLVLLCEAVKKNVKKCFEDLNHNTFTQAADLNGYSPLLTKGGMLELFVFDSLYKEGGDTRHVTWDVTRRHVTCTSYCPCFTNLTQTNAPRHISYLLILSFQTR